MKTRAEIKMQARIAFRAQYGNALGVFLLFTLLSSVIPGVGWLLLMPPLLVGYSYFSIKVFNQEQVLSSDFFSKGFADYGRNLAGVLWMYLFIFLWSLLLFIPGIIKALSYWMTPYILADCPKVEPAEALKLSMRMTQGYKGEIFVMFLSFIGWMLLSAMTGMILYLFYVGPYIHTSLAGYYLELKKNALEKGVVRPEELA
ncbi:MAG: DUF975 family protein [Bacillota bacterium]